MITIKQLEFILNTTKKYNNKYLAITQYPDMIVFTITPDVKIRIDLIADVVTLSKEQVVTNE